MDHGLDWFLHFSNYRNCELRTVACTIYQEYQEYQDGVHHLSYEPLRINCGPVVKTDKCVTFSL